MSTNENNICFTCLKSNTDLTAATNSDYDKITFLEKLEACVSSQLVLEDSKDLSICKPCIINLNICYKFREKALKSLEALGYIHETVLSDDTQETPIEITLLDVADEHIISISDSAESCKSETDDNIHDIIEQMRKEAIAREKDLSCDECSLTFRSKKKLEQHISKAHNKDSLVCMYCGNVYKTSFHLREHITSHTGEKNYNCTHCEKAFPRLSSLKRHIKTHYAPEGQKTKKTPFLCTICGKNFPFSNGAARHMRIHFGLKTHECQICNRKFNQSTHLHAHMRTHSGEKPYVCENCGDCFTLRAGLLKHLKTRHKDVSCEGIEC